MNLSLGVLAAAAFMVFLGALVQRTVGFGMAIVAAPLLYLIEPLTVPGPLLITVIAISLHAVWHSRGHLELRELGSAFLGRIPGIGLALLLLSHTSADALPLLIGIAALSMVAISVKTIPVSPTMTRLIVAGMASGLMGTATAIGGPAMALVYQHEHGDRIRANLSAYFLLGSVLSLLGLAMIDRFGAPEMELSLWMLPPALLGMLAGRYAVPWLHSSFARPAILLLSTVAGLTVIIEALPGYWS